MLRQSRRAVQRLERVHLSRLQVCASIFSLNKVQVKLIAICLLPRFILLIFYLFQAVASSAFDAMPVNANDFDPRRLRYEESVKAANAQENRVQLLTVQLDLVNACCKKHMRHCFLAKFLLKFKL